MIHHTKRLTKYTYSTPGSPRAKTRRYCPLDPDHPTTSSISGGAMNSVLSDISINGICDD